MTRGHGSSGALLFVLGVGLLGCGSEDPPPALRSEPAPLAPSSEPASERTTYESPTAASPPGEPVIPIPPLETERTFEVFTLPADWRERVEAQGEIEVERREAALPPRSNLIAPHFALPDRGAAAEVDRLIREAAVSDPYDAVENVCDVTLAQPRLVGVRCEAEGSGGRTGFERATFAMTFAIDGARVREVRLGELFAPSVIIETIARAACRTEAEERDEDAPCDDELVISVGELGLFVELFGDAGTAFDFRIPWDAPVVEGQLRHDGPLSTMLPAASHRSVTVPIAEIVRAEITAYQVASWAFGPVRPLERAIDHAEALVAVPGGYRAVFSESVASFEGLGAVEARAREAAGGGPIQPLTHESSRLDVRPLGATQELSLRAAPGTHGELVGIVSQGTFLVGVSGELDGRVSQAGGRGSWMRVFLPDGTNGWVAGRYLEPDGCGALGVTVLAEAMPEAARPLLASAIYGQVPGVVFAIVRGADRSWLVDAPDCAFAVRRVIELPGRIEAVRYADHRLVVTSTPIAPSDPAFQGRMRWSLFAPDATTAAWSTEARGHFSVPEAERATVAFDARVAGTIWDLEVRPVGEPRRRARWTGTEVAEATGR